KDNSIESIIEDEKGNLWIGKNSGISVFNPTSNTFTEYSANDGLIGNSFNAAAALKIENGIMFFGSTAGVVFFNPMEISSSDYSPPVLITDFQIFNQSVIIGKDSPLKTSITKTKQISLSYTQSVFSFQFAALDYNSPESIQYAYKMEGFDKEWIYCGSRRFVTYTNLDRGEYVFRVKATNSDGIWNEKGTQIAITINPPFWATWWAYSIYILMFISLLLFLRSVEIKRRIKNEEERLRREREAALLREAKLRAITIEQEKELEKQKIRNRIAQDLHDEIGSNLSSISLMSELIQKDGKINSDVFAKINRIYKVAKGSTQAMRDIVWLTNPSSDSLKDLISKMNEVARDMLGAMKWEFDFSKKISEINLLPETKRNVFFIYKEALNNILKHSDAGNVDIKLNVIDTILCLDIKDDGKGFNTNTGFSGNGLKNLQSRAKEINGKLKINSSPGNGTSLELEVNITQVRD
ncbi:MAG TPA: triple tyrosine motif-containing protein, partial [Ignavibacteriaceae bacterium]|nr:triple tyrosine motif-containing protein [Ignavibacteriaceae bacterium]